MGLTEKEKISFMQRCLDLALMGNGSVAPNPMVGCVIVHAGKIIGEGYHKEFGGSHAEVNAIASVSNKTLLPESTVFVSLEPCAHHGKTPPCSDLLVHNKVKEVIIATLDTYSEVAGKGIDHLKKNGIHVETGILEKEARELNKRFFTFHEKKRPYVILKWAQTKNGFIDQARSNGEKGIFWITSPETKVLVHKWRSEEQAILVGKTTILNDDPELTVRAISGKNPVRIIIDPNCEVSLDHKVFSKDAESIVLNRMKEEEIGNVKYLKTEDLSILSILDRIWGQNIQSVFVEGGRATLQQFIDSGLFDEIRVLVGNTELSKGLEAPIVKGIPQHSFSFGKDQVYIYKA